MTTQTHDKIRLLRETKQWSQENMAEKLNMSPSGYAKIERGETKLNLNKLNKIAEILGIDITELMDNDKQICFASLNENADYAQTAGVNIYHTNYYGNESMAAEIAQLKLMLQHKDEIISLKNNELESMKEVIAILKQQLAK